jgi:hypothetical protein
MNDVYLRSLNSRRRAITWHRLRADERFTICGWPAGSLHRMSLDRATSEYGARPCERCSGDHERIDPMTGLLKRG